MAKTSAAASAGRTAEELKTELRRLVRSIEDDTSTAETFKEAARVLEALKGLQIRHCNGGGGGAASDPVLKRSSPLSPAKPPQPPDKIDRTAEIPDQFICPISSELMKDPVVLITGETYDRRFIESLFNSGNRTCPRTQQIISDLSLTPNNLLRRMISAWCADHGITNAVVDDGVVVTREDRDRLTRLLNMISNGAPAEAIKELRKLTRMHSSHRAMLGENPAAILKLISVPIDDPEVREDTVTTILNLSIHDSNKKTVAEITGIIPFLIESLAAGTMESRSNAAAALFTLSAVDSNKTKIGELGAMGPLVQLVEQGSVAAKRDAASAIFNLCVSHENRERAVKEGAVAGLLKCVIDQSMVDEALAVLAILASNQEAVDEIGDSGGVACLLRVIRESSCAKNRENAVVLLFSVCMNDRTKLREVREEEGANKTISVLAQNGSSRARRKAMGILEKMRRTMHSSHNSC